MEISSDDAKRYFLFSHLLTSNYFPNGNLPILGELSEGSDRLKDMVWGLEGRKLHGEYMGDRRDRYGKWYDGLKWSIENIGFDRMGAYPEMQFLNANFTSGNVLDTAEKLKRASEGHVDFESTPSEKEGLERFLGKIKSITYYQEFLIENVPGILVPGGYQRETFYNLDPVSDGKPKAQIYDFDIDDGNSRIVTYAFNGLNSTKVLVGKE